jgi:carotenoid cleavage dioxygenase-like enzyme
MTLYITFYCEQREDDGVILSTVVYAGEDVAGPNRTSLIILNATSWDLLAKVDFMCETAVPKCLHGWFFPDKSQPPFTYQQRERSLSRQLSRASQY